MSATIILTGANGSLAIPAVHFLLQQSPSYTLVLTVRDDSDQDPNTNSLRRVLAGYPQAQASVRRLDLCDLSSVREFAKGIAREISAGELPPLASIVCNAYYWNLNRPFEVTKDGIEKTFQVIHVAHVALILLLIDSFQSRLARIVLFSTDAVFPGQNSLEKLPPAIPDDLNLLAHPSPDGKQDPFAYGFQRYANAKLAVVTWGLELNRRLEKNPKLKHITVVVVNPGNLSDSRALRVNTPAMLQYMSRLIIQPLRPLLRMMDPTMRTSADAAADIVRLARNDVHSGESGYFILLERSAPPPGSVDEQVAEQLWQASAKWTGVTATDSFLIA